MTSFLSGLYDFFLDGDDTLANLPTILDHQAAEQSLGGVRFSAEWLQQKSKIDQLLSDQVDPDESLSKALKIFAKVIDTLDLYAPSLKGLTDVHAYTCETLESIIFDQPVADKRGQAAAYLYGQAMAMSNLTSEAVSLAIENLLLRGDQTASNLGLCIILGIERSSSILFENHLPVLLRQVQMAAFGSKDKSVSQESLIRALKCYSPSEKSSSCQIILQSTHSLLAASLRLCEEPLTNRSKEEEGVSWCCFIIEHTPMLLRNDLRTRYPTTCSPKPIYNLLLPLSSKISSSAQISLCSALPILATWDTMNFVQTDLMNRTITFMLGLTQNQDDEGVRVAALYGLGQVAGVVLHRFEPFLNQVGHTALEVLKRSSGFREQKAAQRLLARLLSSLGPTTLDVMVEYLLYPHDILLADVELLEMIATLLPNLSKRIIQTLTDIIDDLLSDKECSYPTEAVLEALNVFPLNDRELAIRAQKLVLWSLDEDQGKNVVIAALQLSINPIIATSTIMGNLTFKAAHLLLADDPHVVHVALSVLSNPALASMLDEKSCSMILLALHQSLEPSIQIVAAKLLTHLTTEHKAIVQPLAWSHIRQSLSLIEFLKIVDPNKAVIEACIISNLLPALPPALHRKYVGPVKELIMYGLRNPIYYENNSNGNNTSTQSQTLSLIFQGLSNLSKFQDTNHIENENDGIGNNMIEQKELIFDLLEMTREIPKDCQHASLNAISNLLSIPKDNLDVFDLLIKVHSIFGSVSINSTSYSGSGSNSNLNGLSNFNNNGGGRGRMNSNLTGVGVDSDLKALVSSIYGHLGTVERNPVINRDSKAAINREISLYPYKIQHLSRISEIRDKYGPLSLNHLNYLIIENLLLNLNNLSYNTTTTATTSTNSSNGGGGGGGGRLNDDKSIVIEILTCLTILQNSSSSSSSSGGGGGLGKINELIPDLPLKIIKELKISLNNREKLKDLNSTSISSNLLFLSSILNQNQNNTQKKWLNNFWNQTTSIMSECINNNEVLPTLRGLDIILDSLD
ncbi:uncharacterized protein L201_001333 [Kwoniella dendrophila CBS 6074]|uniref:UNC-45/Cro1/She4 central domain-containing protein n=1 Tax=Kwoniella dendrophila CBS 6074 TaxID=1295534 RepID=A0AAX4JM09_9TREE